MTAVVDPIRMSPPAAPVREMVIEARPGWISLNWAEMLRYRELLYFLVWRDVKVRYKQTALGFGWAVIQPLMNAVISVLIFAGVCGFQRDLPADVPYLLFALVGTSVWTFFQAAVSIGGMSLVNQQHMLTKIYFPRLFLPTGVVGGSVVDLMISLGLVLCFMVVYHFTGYHFTPPVSIPLMFALLVPLAVVSLGMAYLTSAVTITFRDFRFIISFVVQIWAQLSFVSIPREAMLHRPRVAHYEWLLAVNPLYGIIEAFRHVMLGLSWSPWHLGLAVVESVALCVFGMFYFRKTERRFADVA